MCDYSLMNVPNRLAREGEELVVHRFPTGSMGLASPHDIKCVSEPKPARKSIWSGLKEFFNPPRPDPVCAVCIPPGASLRLRDIPARMQQDLHVGAVEDAIFTQITAAVNTYRDAVRFANGRELRLQELREGQPIDVINLENCTPYRATLEHSGPVAFDRSTLTYQ